MINFFKYRSSLACALTSQYKLHDGSHLRRLGGCCPKGFLCHGDTHQSV